MLLYEELIQSQIEEAKLDAIIENIIDTNPTYVLFTSGSTGVKTGAVISHKALTWVKETFNIYKKIKEETMKNEIELLWVAIPNPKTWNEARKK